MTVSANVFTLSQPHAAAGTRDGEQTQTPCDPAIFLALLSGCLGPAQTPPIDLPAIDAAQLGVGAVESVGGPDSAGAVAAMSPAPGARTPLEALPTQVQPEAAEPVAVAGTRHELPSAPAQRPSSEPRVAPITVGALSAADAVPPAQVRTAGEPQAMATVARMIPAAAAGPARPAELVAQDTISPNAANTIAEAEVVPARSQQPAPSTPRTTSPEPTPARLAALPQTSPAATRLDRPAAPQAAAEIAEATQAATPAPVSSEAPAREITAPPADPAPEAQTPARAAQPGPERSVAPRMPEMAAPDQARQLAPTDLPLTDQVAHGSTQDSPAQPTLSAAIRPANRLEGTPAPWAAATAPVTAPTTDAQIAEVAAPTDTRSVDVRPRATAMPEAPRVAATPEAPRIGAMPEAQVDPTPVASEQAPIDAQAEPRAQVANPAAAPSLPDAIVFDAPEQTARIPQAAQAVQVATAPAPVEAAADAPTQAPRVAQQPDVTQQRVAAPAVPAERVAPEAIAPPVTATAEAGVPVAEQPAEPAAPAMIDRASDAPDAAHVRPDVTAGMETHTVLTRAAAGGARPTMVEPTVTIRESVRVTADAIDAQQPTRLVVEVDPPELGRCELELSVHEGRVRAMLIADRPETVVALRSVEGQVREQLAGRALQVAEFDVRQSASHAGQDAPWGEAGRDGERDGAAEPRPMEVAVPRMARQSVPLGARQAALRRSRTSSATIDLVA